MHFLQLSPLIHSLVLFVSAQDGSGPSGTVSNPLASYKCDASCRLPKCRCANAPPPNANPPQFITLTYDDAIQSDTQVQALALFSNRKNPNGCPARATFFSQTYYTDPYLVQQWAAAGNEVADHSMSHGGSAVGGVFSYEEYEGQRAYMTSLAGLNRAKISGVRFPFLNYSVESLNLISKMGFQYDSSMAAVDQERVWPYTLDYGSATDCSGQTTVCGKALDAKGLWEIPMYSIIGTDGKNHLMDPFNDPSITAPISGDVVTGSYKATFDLHYKTKIPFGVYLHPVWIGPGIPPSIPSGSAKFAAVSAFLDYALAQPNTWMVTNQQLLEYMKAPVSASELAAQAYMACPAPPTNICNGSPNSSIPETCNLPNGTIRTCYGCPTTYPDLTTPNPPKVGARCSVPDTCDMLYWDPVACTCTCTATACAFKDTSRGIQTAAEFARFMEVRARDGGLGGGGKASNAAGAGVGAVCCIAMVLFTVFL